MEFLKEVLVAVGGGLGIVLFFLAVLKGVIEKWVNTAIEKTAEKNLAKYANILERRTKAYEMLLEKEFAFFDKAFEFISALVINIQNFSYYMGIDYEYPAEINLEKAKETSISILKSTSKFKRDSLLAESYLTEDIRAASAKIIVDLQKANPLMYNAMKKTIEDVLDEGTIKQILEIEELTLMNCAQLSTIIKMRLEKLSEE